MSTRNSSLSPVSMANCFCMGPQRGEPLCPCEMKMRGIYKKNGRWVEPPKGERDLGLVRDEEPYDLDPLWRDL